MMGAETSERGREEERLAFLLEQMGMMNRISSALNMSLNLDDIHILMLSALVSPKGLGYSRALLFTYNETRLCFEGKLALGPETADEATALREEARAEEEALDSINREMFPENGDEPVSEEDRVFEALFGELRTSALWISSFQDGEASSSGLSRRVQAVTWPFLKDASGHDESICGCMARQEVVFLTKSEAPDAIPAEVLDLLDDSFAVVPICTRKGVRAVVLADRKFHAQSLDRMSRRMLDWFRTQSALAQENAELFSSLNDALSAMQDFDRMKSNFLSITSHELRTPLTAMMGFCELVLNGQLGPVTDRQSEMLRRAVQRGGLLNDMINDLLEIADVEAGGLIDFDIEDVDPLTVMMNAISKMETRRSRKNITIIPHVETGVPEMLRSNENALGRIFFHVLDNAVKFSNPEGTVDVRFFTEGERLNIQVEDQGIGMAPESLERIFDSFFQADQRLTRRHEGIGLGLTITRRLIEALGGTIAIRSQLGKGTTVTLTLPGRAAFKALSTATTT